MTSPTTMSHMVSGRGRIFWSFGRGFSSMRPSLGFPNPRPIAWKTLTVKLSHIVWSGRNGTPPRMFRSDEPRKTVMYP